MHFPTLDNPRLPGLCLLVSWSMIAIGLLVGIGVDASWFARFGSLVVLFALIGEFALLKSELLRLYARLSSSEDGLVHTKDYTPSRWQNKKSVLLHMTIIIGTIIWGFGDLVL